MYRVIKYFTDLQDEHHAYHAGDTFPREGLEVSEERLAELSSDKNKRGIPLIEEVKEAKEELKEETVETEVETVEPKEEPKATKKPAKRAKKG